MERETEQDSGYAYEPLPNEDHKVEIKSSLADGKFAQSIRFQNSNSITADNITDHHMAKFIQFKSHMLFQIITRGKLYDLLTTSQKLAEKNLHKLSPNTHELPEDALFLILDFAGADLILINKSFFQYFNHRFLIPRDQLETLVQKTEDLLKQNENKIDNQLIIRRRRVKKNLYRTSGILGLTSVGLLFAALIHSLQPGLDKESQSDNEFIACLSTGASSLLLCCCSCSNWGWNKYINRYLSETRQKCREFRMDLQEQRESWRISLFPQPAASVTNSVIETNTLLFNN